MWRLGPCSQGPARRGKWKTDRTRRVVVAWPEGSGQARRRFISRTNGVAGLIVSWRAKQRTAEARRSKRFLAREAKDCVRSDVERFGFFMVRHEAARVVEIRPGDADGSGATLTALSVCQGSVVVDSLRQPAGKLGVNVGTDAWRCPSYEERTLQEEAGAAHAEAVS